MRLRKPCSHDRYEEHPCIDGRWASQVRMMNLKPEERLLLTMCPGGEFLPEGALVIEKDADGEWPDWAYEVAARRLEFTGGTDQWKHASYRMAYLSLVFRALESHFALASQVRESER